jgi:hypothetical protein
MTDFIFTVEMEEITLNDLGQSMNAEFERLYRYILAKYPFNKERFEIESSNFFDKNDSNYRAQLMMPSLRILPLLGGND